MDQIILFGDSLTEQSSNQDNGFALHPALQNLYMRRLDVVNRGFSGYNTTMALRVLPHLISAPPSSPTPSNPHSSSTRSAHPGIPHSETTPAPPPRIRLLTLLLGANDSRLPDPSPTPAQHVPLGQFRANLFRILDFPALVAHGPRIVLVTVPPIDERLCKASFAERGMPETTRVAEVTAGYAQVVREVGRERGVVVVDLWAAMMRRAGWSEAWEGPLPGSEKIEQNAVLVSLLRDGLHFTGDGYRVFYDEWVATVTKAYPELDPQAMSPVFPEWDNTERWKHFEGPQALK